MKNIRLLATFVASLLLVFSCEEEKVKISSLTLNQTSIEMEVGESAKLSATIQPEELAGAPVSWSSSDKTIATVTEDGTVTAIAAGQADITALADGKSAKCSVTVKEKGSEEEPDKPDAIKIILSTPQMTQYSPGEGMDTYNLILSSGSVTFDEENWIWYTEQEGWVMILSLNAEKTSDPGNPELPEGKYTLGSELSPGIWNSDVNVNYLTSHTEKEGVVQIVPKTGEIEVKKTSDGYILNATFQTEDQKNYSANYTGRITFQGTGGGGQDLVIDEPVNTKFIGGQAVYRGADPFFSDLGWVQLELWDAEPDPEWGTVLGNIVKLKLFIPIQKENFTSMPSGTWELSIAAGENMAEPGFDNGVDIPTGSYIAQTSSDGSTLKLGMLNQGTITITEDKHVVINTYTEENVSVKGTLDKPLEVIDLSEGGVSGNNFSTLKEDKVIDLGGAPSALFFDYGDLYQNGTRNVILQVFDKNNMKGMIIDMNLPKAEFFAPIPDCTLTLDNGEHLVNTFAKGSIKEASLNGSWGFLKLVEQNGQIYVDNTEAGNAAGGTIKIKGNGNTYTITLDLYDDAETPHSITGSWTGTLEKQSPMQSLSANRLSISRK